MKKKIAMTMCGIMTMCALTTFCNATEEVGGKYPATMLVTEVTAENGTYICLTADGYEYQFDGSGYKVGDCISAIMDDCGTGSRSDDTLISTRKEGWTLVRKQTVDVSDTVEEARKTVEHVRTTLDGALGKIKILGLRFGK